MGIPMEGNNEQRTATVMAHPTIKFHTKNSLLTRIWKSVNHRWLALYLTEHLFHEANTPWSYQSALVFSFQMMAPCGPCRLEFLTPLVGYCLRFPTQESIDLKRKQLQTIWKEPSSFMTYGANCLSQFSKEGKARVVIECYLDLQSEIPSTSKKISYNRDCSWQRRWTILRAYIFHFWLDSVSNNTVKSIVTNGLVADHRKKKRKIDHSEDSSDVLTQLHMPIQVNETCKSPPVDNLKPSKFGFQSITASRRVLKDPPTMPTQMEDSSQLVAAGINPTTSNVEGIDWTGLRLITYEELDRSVKSYFLIHRNDGVDILSELSPLEVYSANNLHELVHCHVSGANPFYPTRITGPVVLNIRSDADCFIDTSSKSYHVAREQSGPFQEYADILPSMKQIQLLCQAVACHGSSDNKRAAGQYRVNIGNGGQNWQNGTPCKLHGMQFEKDVDNDTSMDASQVLWCVGQLTEFTWHVMCSLQRDAFDHPIAPDLARKQRYASHFQRR